MYEIIDDVASRILYYYALIVPCHNPAKSALSGRQRVLLERVALLPLPHTHPLFFSYKFDMVNVSEVLTSFRLAAKAAINTAQQHSDLLRNKFKLVMYEGGPAGAGSGSVDDMCMAAHRHPDMRGILAEYYEGMRRNGMVSALVHFSSNSKPSKYGNWGLIEASDQDPRFAPKQQGHNVNPYPNPNPNPNPNPHRSVRRH